MPLYACLLECLQYRNRPCVPAHICLVLHLCGTMKELDVRSSLLSVSSAACVREYNMDTWISVQKRKGENSLVSIFLFWCDGHRRLPSDDEGLDTMECTLVHLNI